MANIKSCVNHEGQVYKFKVAHISLDTAQDLSVLVVNLLALAV